ncbi:DUF3822 family protein [Postechiella marina]|uniref:DUF3822 family protein n=1 Tax=Postechiella marina TaxID=943941 RepID=A0ABP8C032_9FLAO
MTQTKIKDVNNYTELSIQISLSGLSFCILQKETNTISYLNHFSFNKKLNPFALLDQLKQLFNTEEALQKQFDAVYIIHVNELATLVPKALFNEDNIADYLKFNSKILKSDYITYDDIKLNESVNVYVPYVNINNFIYEKFGAFTFKHFSTILIEQILLLEKNNTSTKIYAHVSSNHFELVITKDGKLLLYNSFEYNSEEDFIYYLLFTAEQLHLNPEQVELVFLGDITKDDAIYNITYKYIRHIHFGNRNDNYKYTKTPNTNHSNFTLIKSF